MIWVHKHDERPHQTDASGSRWRSARRETPEAAQAFRELSYLDEAELRPARTMMRRQVEVDEVVLVACEGSLTLHRGGTVISVAAGAMIHEPSGPEGRLEVRNPSRARTARVFTVGLAPREPPPGRLIEWRWFSVAERRDALRAVASSDARKGSLRLAQNAVIYSAMLHSGRHVVHEIQGGRRVWLHVVRGGGQLGGEKLNAGDAAGIVDEQAVSFTPSEETELLVVDLPRPQGV